ncbi:MAG: hypothetical protein KatS3mg070_1550 [Meiothermus sp.]|uniref:hypothetical protein n=1 Tax=Meiothermus sp. TaxID=1955249 RepID=UPI0021DE3FC4|nr:hypothetical protein [Meiothermus sp.]GIW28187.1 MAG: hypothetical protein KatS3mg070_1550 [Meiothermus sp.]
MAELWTNPKNPDDGFLITRYRLEFWRALIAHAPSCLAYLRERGVEAWLERYGLPQEPYGIWAKEYLKNQDQYLPDFREFGLEPPSTESLSDRFMAFTGTFDPRVMSASSFRQMAHKAVEQYIKDVENDYQYWGWQKTRVKYNLQHFTWLALRLEGLSWAEIADRTDPPVGEDAVRKAVNRLAEMLGLTGHLAET